MLEKLIFAAFVKFHQWRMAHGVIFVLIPVCNQQLRVNIKLGRFWGSDSRKEDGDSLHLLWVCVVWDGKRREQSIYKYFQVWPKMESILYKQLNVFFLGWADRVGGPVKIFPLIAAAHCKWRGSLTLLRSIFVKTKKSSHPPSSWLSWPRGIFLVGQTYHLGTLWWFPQERAPPSGCLQGWSLQSRRLCLCHWWSGRGSRFPGWQDWFLLVLQEGFCSGHLD